MRIKALRCASFQPSICQYAVNGFDGLTETLNLWYKSVTSQTSYLGILRSVRVGRESLYEFNHKLIDEVKQHLEMVSAEWDRALGRLKSFVEAKPDTSQI